MSVSIEQVRADRDRLFADWGEAVVFRQVVQTFTPESQDVSEDVTDTEVTAVVGPNPSQPTGGTATQHLSERLTLLIKSEELPTVSPQTTSRIVRGDVEYDVLGFVLAACGAVFTLECRRRS